MKSNNRGFVLAHLIVIQFIIFVVVATSWFVNLYKFTQCDFEAPYKGEVLHGVGIFPFVSVITCWFDDK